MDVDVRTLKAELARQGLTLIALARRIEARPSTLSAWIHGANPAPPDLVGRIEKALGVKRGTLKRNHP